MCGNCAKRGDRYLEQTRLARRLAEAITVLEASTKDISRDPATDALLDVARSLRETRLEVAMGKPVPMKKMDDLQRELDQLLNK